MDENEWSTDAAKILKGFQLRLAFWGMMREFADAPVDPKWLEIN